MNKIRFNDFWLSLKKHFLIVCIIPLVSVSIIYTFNKLVVPPKYEATTQLIISIQKNNVDSYMYDNIRSSMQLVDTFSSIVQSKKVMEISAPLCL
ncbi:Wzz/FepE/Etk N-terminal domain-containing protein [Bacillus cereus]|nr:Wzz/FepE/Etk N-terminal domain-containing protein [Bacillus cereus]